MNNLTTRKIILGMLMTFVLAFSVQGIADALTTPTVSSTLADLSTVNTGTQIRVTVSTGFNDSNTAETLTIAVANGTYPDPGTPGTTVAAGDNEVWTETGVATNTWDQPLSTLVITPSGPGVVTVSVSTNTETTPVEKRAFYVVNPTDITATGITFNAATDSGDNGIELKSSGDHTIGFSGTVDNTPITVTASSGGTLFVQRTVSGITRNSPPRTSLSTSSAVNDAGNAVRLRLTSTSTITVSHRHFSDRVTYVHGLPTVTITGGNNQEGIAGNRLEQALTVRVTGSNRALPGIPVIFTDTARTGFTSTTGDDGTFIPVLGTTVYTTGGTWSATATVNTQTATSNSPAAVSTNVAVQTDANGVAAVYYQFNSNDMAEEIALIDATVLNVPPAMPFKLDVVSSTRIPNDRNRLRE